MNKWKLIFFAIKIVVYSVNKKQMCFSVLILKIIKKAFIVEQKIYKKMF